MENPDEGDNQDMDTVEQKIQDLMIDNKELVSSESEWVDEEDVSGTSQLSLQSKKTLRVKRCKNRRQRKKLKKCKSTLENKNTDLFHEYKIQNSHLIQSKNKMEFQKPPSGQDINLPLDKCNYVNSKNNKFLSEYKSKLKNSSESNEICDNNIDSNCNVNQISYHENVKNSLTCSDMNNIKEKYHAAEDTSFYCRNIDTNVNKMNTETKSNDYSPAMSMIDEFRQAKKNLYEISKSLKPSDVIVSVRKEIEKLSNDCTSKHLEKIDVISSFIKNENVHKSIFLLQHENLMHQQKEFDSFVTHAKQRLNFIEHSNAEAVISIVDAVKLQIENECHLFEKMLPGYAYRSNILNALNENQVVIVSADCSYFFNVVIPAIIPARFPDHSVLACEGNFMASEYVRNELQNIKIAVDESSSEINYLTEDKMLDILSKSNELKDFIGIINLRLRRSINVDLLLALLNDRLRKQKNAKLILLTSIFDDIHKYQKYFSTFETFILTVPKLLLPVKTMWKKEPSSDYMKEIIDTIIAIHVFNKFGNILAFLADAADAKITHAIFSKEIQEEKYKMQFENVKCVLLQESCSIPCFSYQSNPYKKIIFFASDCAEIIPILSVQFLIDCGVNKCLFDQKGKGDILTTVFSSKATARLRKSLIRVSKPGICYRMYNKEIYSKNMPSHELPDILTLNPLNILIKTFQYFPDNALSIEFVNPINDDVKNNSIECLKNFGAIKNKTLTQLGKKIVKFPLPIRYSKVIFQAIDWGYAYEAVIIIAYFSINLFLFKMSDDKVVQQDINTVKLSFTNYDSDALLFLYVYKKWVENQCSKSWCEKFYINWETLHEVEKKISEICQYIYDYAYENIDQEFNENEDLVTDIIKILLDSFGDHFCVFTGHYKIGYRILSTSETACLHSSSVINKEENFPQFIIFNKMICGNQNSLIGVTVIPDDIVHDSLTNMHNKILKYDYNDIFAKTLIQKSVNPVGEGIIQMLLSRNGKKLQEIENVIKKKLQTECIVIEPLAGKGSVNVYALESFIDSAMHMVNQILKSNVDNINAEQNYILELTKGKKSVSFQVNCTIGAKITSAKIINLPSSNKNITDEINFSLRCSINLSWVRRPCNGICYIQFSEMDFKKAQKLAVKEFFVMDTKLHVEVCKNMDNQLLCSGIPREARYNDIEDSLKKYLPGIEVLNIKLLYSPPFESSNRDLEIIKMDIEDFCEVYADLSEYDVIVPKPNNVDTSMSACINVFCLEDLTEAAEQLSNLIISDGYKIHANPEYKSIIQVDLNIFNALKSNLFEEITILKTELCQSSCYKDLFIIEYLPLQDSVLLSLIANDIQVMKKLRRKINELLEGEVISEKISRNLRKLFCYGGRIYLRALEKSKTVVIIVESNSKIIRIYGTKENCFKAKRSIINYLKDIESETIILNSDDENRIFLASVMEFYGVNLEPLVEASGLLKSVLDIKSNCLLLQGTQESIIKAKFNLDKFFASLNLLQKNSLLNDGEICPVCANSSGNEKFRLRHCGHLYCNNCILYVIMQENFPIQCVAKNCSAAIVMDDICKILNKDEERIKILLYASLNDYLEQNETEIVYCPIPGCSMLFLKKEVSGRWECPLCQNEICIRCGVAYHYGYFCDVFQNTRKDPDQLYKEWNERTMEKKDCPKCSKSIEKKDECYHLTCFICKVHFCWFCLREFRLSTEVYNHLPFCTKCSNY